MPHVKHFYKAFLASHACSLLLPSRLSVARSAPRVLNVLHPRGARGDREPIRLQVVGAEYALGLMRHLAADGLTVTEAPQTNQWPRCGRVAGLYSLAPRRSLAIISRRLNAKCRQERRVIQLNCKRVGDVVRQTVASRLLSGAHRRHYAEKTRATCQAREPAVRKAIEVFVCLRRGAAARACSPCLSCWRSPSAQGPDSWLDAARTRAWCSRIGSLCSP